MNATKAERNVWAAFPVLKKQLNPLSEFLADPAVSEISINRPGEVFIERLGQHEMEYIHDERLTKQWIDELATLVAGANNQSVNSETPLLSAALPTGERFQCVLPPAAPQGGAISIRKQVIQKMSLNDYERLGAFEHTRMGDEFNLSAEEAELANMLGKATPKEFLSFAVKSRVTMLVSGGTSSGKTTMLNALLQEIPDGERIITIEDTPELIPTTANNVSLLASKGDQGMARVTIQSLLQASLRMRPDRLFLGEIRGEEAFSFLQAINTGHPGSLSTVHSNSPEGAYDRLVQLVMEGGIRLERDEIIRYLKSVMPVVVQMTRSAGGKREISDIYYSKAKR